MREMLLTNSLGAKEHPILILLLVFSLGATFALIILSHDKWELYNQGAGLKSKTTVNYKQQDPAFNLTINPDKQFIILLTSFRSGSTFLGNFFDTNPALQYLFEPFHGYRLRELVSQGLVVGARPDHTDSDYRMLYLQQLLHNCTVYTTAVLTEKHRFCGTPDENLARFNDTGCLVGRRNRDGLGMQEICRFRRTTVLKVIRLDDLSDLLKINQIKSANIQIIQLVRHPVGCLMSRMTAMTSFSWEAKTSIEHIRRDLVGKRIKVAWEAYNYCRDHARSVSFIENNPWFKKRYLRLTYSEMALDPIKAVNTVYSFSNLTLTDKVVEYVKKITKDANPAYADRNLSNVYRNSTESAHKWLNLVSDLIKFWDVGSIEMPCKRVLELLGDTSFSDALARRRVLQINSDINSNFDDIVN